MMVIPVTISVKSLNQYEEIKRPFADEKISGDFFDCVNKYFKRRGFKFDIVSILQLYDVDDFFDRKLDDKLPNLLDAIHVQLGHSMFIYSSTGKLNFDECFKPQFENLTPNDFDDSLMILTMLIPIGVFFNEDDEDRFDDVIGDLYEDKYAYEIGEINNELNGILERAYPHSEIVACMCDPIFPFRDDLDELIFDLKMSFDTNVQNQIKYN